MDENQDLRKRLDYVLSGKGAHIGFEKVLIDFPEQLRGATHPAIPYSAWQLLEHMRIAQWDILEFSINKEKLLKPLQPVQAVADKRNTMPILSNLLVYCTEDTLKLFATDLEVSIEKTIDVNTKKSGKTTIPARKFFEIVKELPEGDILISSDENNNIRIVSNSISFRLRGLPVDEFPSLPKFHESSFKSISLKTVKQMIDKTIFSSATEEIQHTLSGIYIEIIEPESNTVRFVATDGHRLSLVDRELDFPSIEEKGII